jgi:glutaredoxin-related protein
MKYIMKVVLTVRKCGFYFVVVQCVQKVTVHLKVIDVMSTNYGE